MNENLINRLQNYTLNRKIISIDSDDRDFSKWSNANEFEVVFPQNYNNIESIRLLNINIPNKLYNIASYLENNKLDISTNTASSNPTTITIPDGIYNIQQLTNKLNELFINNSDNLSTDICANHIEASHKITITSDSSLVFDFNVDISNTCVFNSQSTSQSTSYSYSKYNRFGLGTVLGFNKNKAESESNSDPSFIIIPPNQCNLGENRYIYMEIEGFNTCDELIPNLSTTNYNYFNRNNGKVNSYFAKIPIINNSNNQSLSGKATYSESLSYYQPPIKKMSKLKFKFRYHNGTLVDFHNYNISFDLEINEIRNEIKNYNVRLPFTVS